MLGFMNEEAYEETKATGKGDLLQPYEKPYLDER